MAREYQYTPEDLAMARRMKELLDGKTITDVSVTEASEFIDNALYGKLVLHFVDGTRLVINDASAYNGGTKWELDT